MFLTFLALFSKTSAATWYVDGSATGATNGKSWANAWTTVQQISGLAAGDTVYISGGSNGSTKTYNLSGSWTTAVSGAAGKRITYQIGQDSAHNGTAIFNCTVSGQTWLNQGSNFVVSGDAGDGKQHFKLTGFSRVGFFESCTNVRVGYVYADTLTTAFDLNPITGFEIDHNYFKIATLTADHAMFMQVNGSTWNDTLIHDNFIWVPNAGNGFGADCFQCDGTGVSIYDNDIYGYVTSYTGNQHQDGWQSTGLTSYIKIYGNYFQDIANYPVFGDAYYGGFTHVWVYDNIMVLATQAISTSAAPQGLAIGPDTNSFKNLGAWPVFSDIVVTNNLIADYGKHLAIAMGNNPNQYGTFTGCVIQNNVLVNAGPLFNNSGVTTTDNLVLTAAQATADFASYTSFSQTDDFHVKSSADSLFTTAVNVLSLFTTDFDGTTLTRSVVGPYSLTSTTASTTAGATSGSSSSTSSTTASTASSPLAPVITAHLTWTVAVGAKLNYGIYANNSPTSFSATPIPPGLTFNPGGGIIGTPTTAGVYSITMTASNAYGTDTKVLVLTVTPATTSTVDTSSSSTLADDTTSSVSTGSAPVITSSLALNGTAGLPVDYQIAANNSPTAFNAAPLPAGLSVGSDGEIAGALTSAGVYSIEISATNAFGTDTETLVLTVAPAATTSTSSSSTASTSSSGSSSASTSTSTSGGLAPKITAHLTWTVQVGALLNYGIYANNTPTSFAATPIPAGLTFNPGGGIIGYPTTAGVYDIQISASNAYGTDTETLVLTVTPSSTTTASTASTPETSTSSSSIVDNTTASTTTANGSINFDGEATTDTGNLATATSFTSITGTFVDPSSQTGIFASIPSYTTVAFSPFSFDASGVTPLWTFTSGNVTYSFDATSVAINTQNSTVLDVGGSGVVHITGEADTAGHWTITDSGNGPSFSFGEGN